MKLLRRRYSLAKIMKIAVEQDWPMSWLIRNTIRKGYVPQLMLMSPEQHKIYRNGGRVYLDYKGNIIHAIECIDNNELGDA